MNPTAQGTTATVAARSGGALPRSAGPWFARASALVRRIIGAPDYETYVRHMVACHPGQRPLAEREFEEERLTARYSKPGQRCC